MTWMKPGDVLNSEIHYLLQSGHASCSDIWQIMVSTLAGVLDSGKYIISLNPDGMLKLKNWNDLLAWTHRPEDVSLYYNSQYWPIFLRHAHPKSYTASYPEPKRLPHCHLRIGVHIIMNSRGSTTAY